MTRLFDANSLEKTSAAANAFADPSTSTVSCELILNEYSNSELRSMVESCLYMINNWYIFCPQLSTSELG